MAAEARLPALDAIRGMAALCVAIGFHDSHFYFDPQNPISGNPGPLMWRLSNVFANGWLCVDLFFVLSGFVFSYVYRQRIATGLGAGSFAWAWISRLYPLHLLMLAVVLATVIVRRAHGFGDFIFQADYNRLPSAASMMGFGLIGQRFEFNGPAWSISCEIFCYALFYTIIRYRNRWRICFWLAFVAIGALGIHVRPAFYPVVNLNMGRALFGFFTGCMLFEGLDAKSRLSAGLRMGWLGLSAFVIVRTLIAGRLPYELHEDVLLVFPAIIAAVVKIPLLARGFTAPPLLWLGARSYTIYMVHYPLQCLFVTGAALCSWHFNPDSLAFVGVYACVVLATAAFAYRYVERSAMLGLRRAGLRYGTLTGRALAL